METKQTNAITPIDQVRNSIMRMENQFKMALPSHIPVDRFMRVAITAIAQSPGLLDCNRQSLFGGIMKACQDGLLPDGRESALVKFKDAVVYMPMIAGILKKIRNSGELASITSHVLYRNDKFRYWVDSDGEHIEHEPNLFGDRGERIGVYALAKTKDGAVYIEAMTTQQVQAVKNSSRSGTSGPWSGAFEDEMWRKTAIRRLSKRLPMSTDLDIVIRRDDELYDLDTPSVTDSGPQIVPPEKLVSEPKKRSRVKDIIAKAIPPVEVKQAVNDQSFSDQSFNDQSFNDQEIPL